MNAYLWPALAVVAVMTLAVIVFAVAKRRRDKHDDLTALADALNPQPFDEQQLEALRSLFLADQQPDQRRQR